MHCAIGAATHSGIFAYGTLQAFIKRHGIFRVTLWRNSLRPTALDPEERGQPLAVA